MEVVEILHHNIANVETWDGTSWTETNDLNSARYIIWSSWRWNNTNFGLVHAGNYGY